MPRPLYPRYPLDRSLVGPECRLGRGGEDKKESNLGRPARSLVTTHTHTHTHTYVQLFLNFVLILTEAHARADTGVLITLCTVLTPL